MKLTRKKKNQVHNNYTFFDNFEVLDFEKKIKVQIDRGHLTCASTAKLH